MTRASTPVRLSRFPEILGPTALAAFPGLTVGILAGPLPGLGTWLLAAGTFVAGYRRWGTPQMWRVTVTTDDGHVTRIDPSQSSLEELFDPCRPTCTHAPWETQS